MRNFLWKENTIDWLLAFCGIILFDHLVSKSFFKVKTFKGEENHDELYKNKTVYPNIFLRNEINTVHGEKCEWGWKKVEWIEPRGLR